VIDSPKRDAENEGVRWSHAHLYSHVPLRISFLHCISISPTYTLGTVEVVMKHAVVLLGAVRFRYVVQ
jgi:hypothetical protein